jgi:outer membrane protein assembly factor BamB
MTTADTGTRKPLRLWPGVVAVGLQWLIRFGVPLVVPDAGDIAILGGLAGGLLVLLWWLFFSRAPWAERLGITALMVGAVVLTSPLVHESIAGGMMGLMLPVFAIPVVSMALVASAAASRRRSTWGRRVSMAVAIVLACASLTLIRTNGVTGDASSDLAWRWTPTPEQRLLAAARDEPALSTRTPAAASSAATSSRSTANDAATTPAPGQPLSETRAERVPALAGEAPRTTAAAPADENTPVEAAWPGFRGPARDSVVRGVRIETDWTRSPPVQLWRRPIGPGWSSFAVRGDLLYTQEQRGEEEVVAAYRVSTGEPVWRHRDAVRFWESNGGAGPRATPTVVGDRLYTFGATGIVNALDADDGRVVWSRNAATDTGTTIPDWGFSSSPLIVGDLVVIAAAGQLVAYDVATGDQRWVGPARASGYSSPHLVTIGGVPQVVLLRGGGAMSVAPADGTVLWEHAWRPAASILQPALAAGGDVLITGADGLSGVGIRRVAVARGEAGWMVEERWTSNGLKPFFNDFVVHDGHAFGFDGSILAAVDLSDGTRKWKGGRYGHGQMLLLADQDVLLVLSEDGELALVRATPDQFVELARVPALEGKTWNHPVLVGDVLLVRNGEEMAAFRLSLTSR